MTFDNPARAAASSVPVQGSSSQSNAEPAASSASGHGATGGSSGTRDAASSDREVKTDAGNATSSDPGPQSSGSGE
jgi:hypothetical protein